MKDKKTIKYIVWLCAVVLIITYLYIVCCVPSKNAETPEEIEVVIKNELIEPIEEPIKEPIEEEKKEESKPKEKLNNVPAVKKETEIKTEIESEEPEPQIKEVEPKEEIAVQSGGLQSMGTFTATAYCPCSKCCGKWANGITSTGVTAQSGRTIAVDPKVIPYGTEVVINGHTYVAEDCGGAIKGKKIDIYFDTHAEALEFGRKSVELFKKES